MSTLPESMDQWLVEIARAYRDAHDAIPFGPLVGEKITENELFHIAPEVAIKFRGLKRSRTNRRKATEAALSTYVANEKLEGNPLQDPVIAFSLCYLTSHLGLGILKEETIEHIMAEVENRYDKLIRLIRQTPSDARHN